MQKIVLALLSALLLLSAPAARAADAPAARRLTFSEDGTFTVLVLSDLQDTQYTSPYLLRAVRNLLAAADADLVVLLGDQLEGASPVIRLGNGYENVKRTIANLLAPIDEAGVPFALVFGNHDYDAPASTKRQLELYRADPLCIVPEKTESGAYALPVYGFGGATKEMNLFFFDTGNRAADGGYDTVSEAQVGWYNETSAASRAENGGEAVPAAAFMHAVVPEVYEIFEKAPSGAADAVDGVGSGGGERYFLNSPAIFTGEALEAPCPSAENHGAFDAFLGNDDVFLAVSGHDHLNSFIAALRGVDLASVPGCTYTGYGAKAARGARLFRFTEGSVRDYETMLVSFSDYDNEAGIGALHYYLTTTTRIPNAVKAVAAGALLLGVMAALIVQILKKEKAPEGTDLLTEEEKPEDPYL